jgi:EpsI family protein
VLAALAAGTAYCLLAGAALRCVEAALQGGDGSAPLARGTLQGVPLQLGRCDPTGPGPCWQGAERDLGEHVVSRTGTDDHIYRKYWTTDGAGEPVTLLVLAGSRPRDLQPHRPEVCYPAAGWTRSDYQQVSLLTTGGVTVPVQLQRFVRGGLSREQVWVLSYYIVDGAFAADLSAVRGRSWRPGNAVRRLTQVQVIVPADRRPQESAERVRAFASVSAESIRQLLAPSPEDDTRAGPITR